MGLDARAGLNVRWALLLGAIVAAVVPLLLTLALGRPLDASVVMVETMALAVIGFWGIYTAMRGIEKYDYIIKEETKRHHQTKEYASQLEYVIKKEAQHHRRTKEYAMQLESNLRVKDLFGDIIAHDLMNPIGIIKNFSQLMLEDEEDEKKRAYLQSVQRSADRVMGIVSDTGKLAKLESLEKLELFETNLCSTILSILEDLDHAIGKKNLKVECNIPGNCSAMVNRIIDDAFYNLLSNAIKYSPKGGKIVIAAEDAGDAWRISFKDNGHGVADEDKNRIFERFMRLEKGNIRGTGLGLAIVKRAVELHRGKVWVEDNPDRGSIFYVEIPKKRMA